MTYKLTVADVVSKLRDGKLRPERGSVYEGMTTEDAAAEYLRRCAAAGICAGCYNPLDDEDREFNGVDTNVCLPCACY